MTDRYTEIEHAVLGYLRAADALDDVKTFEDEVRECLFSGDKLIQGFRPEELPAIAVTSILAPVKSVAETAGEIRYTIPVSVIAIARAARKAEARAIGASMLDRIEALLQRLRKSNDALGANCWLVGEVVSSIIVVPDGTFWYSVGTVSAEIVKVVNLEN